MGTVTEVTDVVSSHLPRGLGQRGGYLYLSVTRNLEGRAESNILPCERITYSIQTNPQHG